MKNLLLVFVAIGITYSCQKEEASEYTLASSKTKYLTFENKEAYNEFRNIQVANDLDNNPTVNEDLTMAEAAVEINKERIELINSRNFHSNEQLNEIVSLYDAYQLMISYKALEDDRFTSIYEQIEKFVMEADVSGHSVYHLNVPFDVAKSVNMHGAVSIGEHIHLYDKDYERVVYTPTKENIEAAFMAQDNVVNDHYLVSKIASGSEDKGKTETAYPVLGQNCHKVGPQNWFISMQLTAGRDCNNSVFLDDNHQAQFGSIVYSWLLYQGNMYPFVVNTMAVVFDAPGTFIRGYFTFDTRAPLTVWQDRDFYAGTASSNTNTTYATGNYGVNSKNDCNTITNFNVLDHKILYSAVFGSNSINAVWEKSSNCPL